MLGSAGKTTPSRDLTILDIGEPGCRLASTQVASRPDEAQALISLADSPALISTLRGLALSAIGIRRVSTPAS